VDRAKLDKWCEWGILGLVLGALCFSTLATGAVRELEFIVVQAMVCGALLLWVIRIWAGSRHRFWWPPICWAVLAFLAYVIIGYEYSDIEYVARLLLIRVVVYAALFFLVLNNCNRQELALVFCLALIFLGSFDALYAIYQYAAHSGKVWGFIRPPQYHGRVGGSFINPNHLAGFLETIIPLALALVVAGRLGPAFKVVLAYLAGLMIVALGLTFSRGGYFASGLSLVALLLVLLSRRGSRLASASLLVVLLAGGWYFFAHSSLAGVRVREVGHETSLLNSRYAIWASATRMWLDRFWFGVGPGHFDARFPQYRTDLVPDHPDFAHNDYLNTLADFGLVGALLVASAFLIFFWGVCRTLPFVWREGNDLRVKQSNKPALVLGGAMGLLALLIHAFTEFNLQIPATALLACALLALVSGHLRFATERFWVSPQRLGKPLATLVLLGVLAWLATQGAHRFRKYYWLRQAGGESAPATPARVAALKQALVVEPFDGEVSYNLGETLRALSLAGDAGSEDLAREALTFYERGMALNRWDPFNYLRYGMCLDWLGQHGRATPYYDHAVELDPNNYYIAAFRGWHCLEQGDYHGARLFYIRSWILWPWDNPYSQEKLPLIDRLLAAQKAAAKK